MARELAVRGGLRRSFITPEGVDLKLELASAGARAGAFLIDAMIIIGVLVVVSIILGLLAIGGGGEPFAVIWLIGFFVLRNGWFILFEMGGRGATPGKRLMVAYRLRYEPFNMTAIKMLRGGELGKIKYIEAGAGFSIGDPTQWRLKREYSGGGSLMDIGIYGLNAIRYLSGEEPVEVTAVSYSTPGDPRFKECEETILFDMRMASGFAKCGGCCRMAGASPLPPSRCSALMGLEIALASSLRWRLLNTWAAAPSPTASARNCSAGKPGTSAKAIVSAPAR